MNTKEFTRIEQSSKEWLLNSMKISYQCSVFMHCALRGIKYRLLITLNSTIGMCSQKQQFTLIKLILL